MHATSEIMPEGAAASITILLAEDEVLLRMVTSDHFRASGFHVLEAANGEEARKLMGAIDHIDIVLTDIHMATPTEGLELAAWLSVEYPDTPVILTSGNRGVAENNAWKVGASVTDFVPKPYLVEDMERLVRLRAASRNASSK
jgi:CheY-like chemotaxis protein